MKKSRDWFSTLAIIGGLLLVLYPTISNFVNLRNATRVIEGYDEVVETLTDDEAAQLMYAARTYNAKLAGLSGIPGCRRRLGMPSTPRWPLNSARSTWACSTSPVRA